MKKIAIVLLLFSQKIFSQECDCGSDFDWMVNTFEKNDAGFQYVVDKKGKDEYQKFLSVLRDESKKINSLNACQKTMMRYLRFFRSGHVGIGITGNNAPVQQGPEKPEDIRARYKNEKKLDLDEKQLKQKLDGKKDKNPIEGIWASSYYTLGIIENENSKNAFNAMIIKADSVYWMPGQIKASFVLNAGNPGYAGNWWMRDHSKDTAKAQFLNDKKNLLKINGDYWQRLYPKNETDAKDQLLLQFLYSRTPFVKKLSNKTIYLRIPSFLHENKRKIDSVLAANHKLISSTENLIIDIRNGTGGADGSYAEIIKYLYTNPIRSVGVQLLGTELNAKAYEQYAAETDPKNAGEIKRLKEIAQKLRENPGKFVDQGEVIYVDSSFKPMLFPKKVGIMVNHNNGSTDEQFLLEAKPSRKVKVFGWSTGGMLDISNVNEVNSPDGKFQLAYCMSKSYRIPNYCIDGIGIQPDYFIDDKIPESEWINYVWKTLEE